MSVLFRLPRELRDQIYEYCLVREEPIRVYSMRANDYWDIPKYGLGLLCVSRAVSLEAVAVLYSRNILDFTRTYSDQVNRFFKLIGRRNASHIHHISIAYPLLVQTCNIDWDFLDNRYAGYMRAIHLHCLQLPALISIRLDRVSIPDVPKICYEEPEDRLGMEEASTEVMGFVYHCFQTNTSLNEVTGEVDHPHLRFPHVHFPPLTLSRVDFKARKQVGMSYENQKQVEGHEWTSKLVAKPMEEV